MTRRQHTWLHYSLYMLRLAHTPATRCPSAPSSPPCPRQFPATIRRTGAGRRCGGTSTVPPPCILGRGAGTLWQAGGGSAPADPPPAVVTLDGGLAPPRIFVGEPLEWRMLRLPCGVSSYPCDDSSLRRAFAGTLLYRRRYRHPAATLQSYRFIQERFTNYGFIIYT